MSKSDLSHTAPEVTKRKEAIQKELDEALADSFPASDPVSIVTSQREEAWEDEEDPTKK
jgi:hypothetical protein